jgi:dTDP-4-dehydrorhamnose reductase
MLGHALGAPLETHETLFVDIDECDITDASRVHDVFSTFAPEVVIHAAAWTDVDGCERNEPRARSVNVDGSVNVASQCARLGARLIALSTDYVFARDLGRPCTEEDPPSPASVYGRTKWEGEQGIAAAYPSAAIVRTSGLYGPRGRHFPGAIARQILAGKPLRVVGDQIVSPTYSRDLAEVLVRLMVEPTEGIYHAANAGPVSWADFARWIAEVMGTPGHPVTNVPSSEMARPAPRPAYSALACERLARDHGITLRSWRDAFAAYYEDEGGAIT